MHSTAADTDIPRAATSHHTDRAPCGQATSITIRTDIRKHRTSMATDGSGTPQVVPMRITTSIIRGNTAASLVALAGITCFISRGEIEADSGSTASSSVSHPTTTTSATTGGGTATRSRSTRILTTSVGTSRTTRD